MKKLLCLIVLASLAFNSSADDKPPASRSMAKFMLNHCVNIDDLSHCMISLGYECKDAINPDVDVFNCTYPFDGELVIYELTRPTESRGWLMRMIKGPRGIE